MDKVKDFMSEEHIIDMFESEPISESETVPPKIGIVVGCPRLNVRMKPNAEATVVCVIDRDSKVMLDEENSTRSFYKICTEVGVEGYCMKQFINVLN